MVFPLLAQYTHFEKYYLFCVQRHEEVVTTQIYQSAGTQYSIRTVSRGGTASMALSNVKKPHLRNTPKMPCVQSVNRTSYGFTECYVIVLLGALIFLSQTSCSP